MAQFDIQGARQAGYSDDEIAHHLYGDRYQAAIDAGYTPEEMVAQHPSAKAAESTYQVDRAVAARTIREGQADMAKSQAYGTVVEAPRRVYESGRQLLTAGAELAGLAPEGSTGAYTDYLTARRFAATGGDTATEAAADLGETVLLSLPGVNMLRGVGAFKAFGKYGLLKNPETWTGALVQGIRQGAIAGGLAQGATEGDEYTTAADIISARWDGMKLGGTFGAAGSVFAVPGAVRNTIAKGIRESEKNAATLQALENSWLDPTQYTASQRSGNTIARNMEVQIAATKAQNFFNRQFIRFGEAANAFGAGMRVTLREGYDTSSTAIALRVQKAYRQVKDEAYTAANANYGARVSRSLAMAAQDAERFPIPYDNLQSVNSKWSDTTGGPWWRKTNPGAESWTPEFAEAARYMDELDMRNARIIANGGQPEGLTLAEMIRMRQALNKADAGYYAAKNSPAGPTTAQLNQHRMVSEMRDAIDSDLDTFVARNTPDPRGMDPNMPIPEPRPAVKAITEFRDANRQYREFRTAVDDMDQNSVAQAFGYRIPQDPEKALVDIAGREASQQEFLVRMLRQHDPEALQALQINLVDRAIRNMPKSGGPAVAGSVSPEDWMAAMTTKDGRPLGEVIFNPAQRAEIDRGMNTVRLLLNGPVVDGRSVASVGRAPEFQGIGMALSSLSSAFLARAAIRVGGLTPIEKMLFTEEGLRLLETARPVIRAWQSGKLNPGILKDHRDAVNAIAKIFSQTIPEEITE